MAKSQQQEELDRLVLAIAEALDLTTEAVAKAFEENRAEVHFGHDERGRRSIGVRIDGRAARFAAGLAEAKDEESLP